MASLASATETLDQRRLLKVLTDNVNFMASNLTSQVRNIADVTTAVAYHRHIRKPVVVAELISTVAELAAARQVQ